MFQKIYEVRLEGRDIEISESLWDEIRECARGHKFFLVEYMGTIYKYVQAKTFYERPTRFDFEIATPSDEAIEIIHI